MRDSRCGIGGLSRNPHPDPFTLELPMLGYRPMTQNPPFPSPEELKAKLSEFMKTNFGDKVSFQTYTEPAPETAEAGAEEKRERPEHEQFVFDFLPRDIKAHLDRFVIQ